MRWFFALALAALLLAPQLANAKPRAVRHTIKRGDTLTSIAKQYGTNVASIRRWNALKKGTMLVPGTTLGVPLPPGAPPPREKAEQPSRSERAPGQTWKSFVGAPARPGFVALEGYTATWSGQALDAKGKLTAAARDGFGKVLASKSSGESAAIDDRLLELMVKVSDTFAGRTLHVVSGYRPGQRSRHAHGDAVDFWVEGVPNWALRDYVRTFERVGVGWYPNSFFVHLDVRETSAYWIDVSRPGQRARYVKPPRRAKKRARR